MSELNKVGGSYPRITRCLGLTQAKLAELVGGTRNSIARWERGELGKIVVVRQARLERATTRWSWAVVCHSFPDVDVQYTALEDPFRIRSSTATDGAIWP